MRRATLTRAQAESRAAALTATGIETRVIRAASSPGGFRTVNVASQRAAAARYRRTPKNRAVQARYGKTEKRRASCARYATSEKGRAAHARYRRTLKGQSNGARGGLVIDWH
jgi:hypothetical protein